MRSEPPPFEVHCPSCDVTFPVGTRLCIHCGGATAQSDSPTDTPSGTQSRWQSGFGRAGSADLNSEWDNSTAFPALTEPAEAEPVSAIAEQPAPFDDVELASEEPGPGRSILRSLGSLIWIALLIAFSLSGRACGD